VILRIINFGVLRMGCEASKFRSGANVDNNLIALVMLDDTDGVIRRVKSMGDKFNVNSKVNVRGDTLLHYAAKRKNESLIEFLLRQPGINVEARNEAGKAPKDLASAALRDKLRTNP
jgi:ankyrin repeat protein